MEVFIICVLVTLSIAVLILANKCRKLSNELDTHDSSICAMGYKLEQSKWTADILRNDFDSHEEVTQQRTDALLSHLGLEVVNEPSKIKVVKKGK